MSEKKLSLSMITTSLQKGEDNIGTVLNLESHKRLNELSKQPKCFPKFSSDPSFVQNLVRVLESFENRSSEMESCDTSTLLVGTLANIAVDFTCRQILIENTEVLKLIETWLDLSTLPTHLFARLSRLIANLARVESAAEEMFSTNIVFSLLKHASCSTHWTSSDCTQCIVRSVRMLCAGRAGLLGMMLSHGGVAIVCRHFSPHQPESLKLEILKTLKELCSTNCTIELAGQIKDSGILPALVETASSASTSNAVHLALRVVSDLVQFSVTRAILGCSGAVRLFFSVIQNSELQFSNVQVSKCVSGLCYLSRECLTRLKMRDQGYLPQLVSLLAEQKFQKHFSNIVTSLFCFSNDEPALIIMVHSGLVEHLCQILDENAFEETSHVKCSEKCLAKEKELQQLRPDLFSLDFGTPFEYYNLARPALPSASSPYSANFGDMSPPWSSTSATSPNRMMSPPRSSRQWLPFSQSPNLELSPNHYLSPTYQSSYSFDLSSVNTFAGYDFSDDEENATEEVVESETRMSAESSQLDNNRISRCSKPRSSETREKNEEEIEKEDLDDDCEILSVENVASVDSGLADSDSTASVKRPHQQSPPNDTFPRSKRRRCSLSGGESEVSVSTIKCEAFTRKHCLTCIETNILHLLNKLSLVRETAVVLCKAPTMQSMLKYYAKLSHPNAQLQRIFERLIENVTTFMELIRHKFPSILYRTSLLNESLSELEPIVELVNNLLCLMQSNAESKYNYSELFSALAQSPIEMQFSIAVSLPFILKNEDPQRVFLVEHFALDLLVNSFSKTKYLSDLELRDAVLALRRILQLVEKKLQTGSSTEPVVESASRSCEEVGTNEILLKFDDSVEQVFDKNCLSRSSQVFKVMLSSTSGFSEKNRSSIDLKDVKSCDFNVAFSLIHDSLVCTSKTCETICFDNFIKEDPVRPKSKFSPFGLLNILEMYDFIPHCKNQEALAFQFRKCFTCADADFRCFVEQSPSMNNLSMTTLNFVSIVVFQHLFASSEVSECDCVEFMKLLLDIPQFSSLLLECFSEKVLKFYFPSSS